MLLGWRKQMVVHPDYHRDKDDRVVEQVELDAWNPELDQTGRNRPPEEVVTGRGLRDQQEVFDVVEELDRERSRPPPAVLDSGKSRAEDPQTREHDERVGVVQHFRLDEPGIIEAEQAARLGDRPPERINLKRLKEVLGPVREHDRHEYTQRELMMTAVQPFDQRLGMTRSNGVRVRGVHVGLV